jgi:hypothetical protein
MDDHEHRARLARSHSVFGADRFGRAAERFAGTRHAAFRRWTTALRLSPGGRKPSRSRRFAAVQAAAGELAQA